MVVEHLVQLDNIQYLYPYFLELYAVSILYDMLYDIYHILVVV